jgi:hypothetical protein
LKETLLLKSDEETTKETRSKESDEEIFMVLKENIEEDNEFCEQLLEHCRDEEFLVSFCIQRREEYNIVFQNYKRDLMQVDIGGHPPIPTGSKQCFGNLLFLAVFSS